MKYEIINPSDKAFLDADDLEVAAVACVFIGRGQYGLDPETKGATSVPVFIFGGADEWFAEQFGRSFSDSCDLVKRDKLPSLIECLRSARLAGKRSSLNDFTGYAHRLAEKMENDAAPDPGRPAQIVFVASAAPPHPESLPDDQAQA